MITLTFDILWLTICNIAELHIPKIMDLYQPFGPIDVGRADLPKSSAVFAIIPTGVRDDEDSILCTSSPNGTSCWKSIRCEPPNAKFTC